MEIKFKPPPFLMFSPIFARFSPKPLRVRQLRKCKRKVSSGRRIFIALNVSELSGTMEKCVDKLGADGDCWRFPMQKLMTIPPRGSPRFYINGKRVTRAVYDSTKAVSCFVTKAARNGVVRHYSN